MPDGYRLDDLARAAGVATTTVRLYRTRNLLAPPRLEGRTGWYDESHLRRLQLIGRLQDQGYSLAGIGHLLERWEEGGGLADVLGGEVDIDALLGEPNSIVLDQIDLISRFPEGSMTTDLVQRAGALGLISPTDDGRLRLADRRFLTTGSALAQLGVPLDVVLDEWEALLSITDELANRFLTLFEAHLAPASWRDDLSPADAHDLAATLARLKITGHEVVDAALDASIARIGREQLAELMPEPAPEAGRPG